MADAQRKSDAQHGMIASCAATDCTHNEGRSCTASEVQVAMRDGKPVCGTYASEKPKPRP